MGFILFVDDSEDIREIYSDLISGAGYKVVCAPDVDEALKALEQKPTLILTDIIMPRVSGIEFIKMIRKGDSSIPIIAISGDPRQNIQSTEAGANIFMEKPFSSDCLLEEIDARMKT